MARLLPKYPRNYFADETKDGALTETVYEIDKNNGWADKQNQDARELVFRQLAAGAERAPIRLASPIQDKNFYLLSLIERTPRASRAVHEYPALGAVAKRKLEALGKAFSECTADQTCATEPLRFSQEESVETVSMLRKIYQRIRLLGATVSPLFGSR